MQGNKIKIKGAYMARKKENAVVLSQERIAEDIYSMWIKTDAASEAKPG